MKSTKQRLQYIILGVIACAAGVFIFFQTENFLKVMVIGIGAFTFVNGSGALFITVKSEFDETTRSMLLIRGILGVVVGVVAVLLPMASNKNIWSIMLYVLAGELTISAVLTLLTLNGLKRTGTSLTRPMINTGISAALALVIFIMPKESGQLILSVIAGIIVIYGITMIFAGLSKKKAVSDPSSKSGSHEKKSKKHSNNTPANHETEAETSSKTDVEASPEKETQKSVK